MERGERRPRVFVGRGQGVRLIMEGGVIVDVQNPEGGGIVLKQKTPDIRVEERETLIARFSGIFSQYTLERLFYLAHASQQSDEGTKSSAEVAFLEARERLEGWITNAAKSGISNREIIRDYRSLLSKGDELSPVGKSILAEVTEIVNQVYSQGKIS